MDELPDNGKNICTPGCGHSYHFSCFAKYVTVSDSAESCPYCRQDIPSFVKVKCVAQTFNRPYDGRTVVTDWYVDELNLKTDISLYSFRCFQEMMNPTGYNVDMDFDREFVLNLRNIEYTYDYLKKESNVSYEDLVHCLCEYHKGSVSLNPTRHARIIRILEMINDI
jgi:hypothetical protein